VPPVSPAPSIPTILYAAKEVEKSVKQCQENYSLDTATKLKGTSVSTILIALKHPYKIFLLVATLCVFILSASCGPSYSLVGSDQDQASDAQTNEASQAIHC
jgi:hypothetical protein